MINKTWSRKTIAFCLAVAVLSVYSMVVLATPAAGISGELSVKGQVTVNGQMAVSGATVFTDSVITTGDNSSATVNLGKLGRVELLPNSSLKVSFNEGTILSTLNTGRVRISSMSGTSALVNTLNGVAMSDINQSNTFVVDTTCGNTQVSTLAGNITLRSNGVDKQVAAGKDATIGQATGTQCSRLAGAQSGGSGLSGGALAAILLAAGGAIVGAIIAGTSDNDSNIGGGTTIVSPVR